MRYHQFLGFQVIKLKGWDVVRHVIRGHWNGRSDHKPSFFYDSFHQILLDLQQHVEEVRGSYHRVVLVGKSLGGLLAVSSCSE